MAIEAIEEYLAIADYCLSTTKQRNDGVYGYPAVLLLFSVLDALNKYSGYPEHTFRILHEVDPRLSAEQIKRLKKWFRNPASHEAIIAPGTKLSLEEGDPFECKGQEPVHIRVRPFFRAVRKAWGEFDRSRISPAFHPNSLPMNPFELSGAASSKLTTSTSGTYIPTGKLKTGS